MNYYKQNTEEFIKNTINVDMTDIYTKFLCRLEQKSTILDIGCGAGRDLKFFKESGYSVCGIEPCKELASFSREYSSCEVIEVDIQSFEFSDKFDGIWACASLLHLNDDDLKIAFNKIAELSHLKTVVYCSFKYGDFQGDRNGRYFNDKTLESLSPFIVDFKLLENWITEDLRPGRDEKWLNIILKS